MSSSRRFGVEIECGHRQYSCYTMADLLSDGGFDEWTDVDYDGSGIEIRSPILQGREGFRELERVFSFLNGLNCYVSSADGMHIHHDAPEFLLPNGKDNLIRLVESWGSNQDLIDRFVAPRRRDSHACPKQWDNPREIESLKKELEGEIDYYYDEDRERGALNVNALVDHGTIEIRQHEGTLDFEQAKAWIEFGQYFLDNVAKRKRPIACPETTTILLNRLRVPKATKEKLIARAGG